MIVPLGEMQDVKNRLPVGAKIRCVESSYEWYRKEDVYTVSPGLGEGHHQILDPKGVNQGNGHSAVWEVLTLAPIPLRDYL